MITIRHAYLEEYEIAATMTIKACLDIQAKLKVEDWEKMRTYLSSTTQLRNGGELLIAIKEEMMVGVAVYNAPESSENIQIPKEWGMISLLVVTPKARGLGIGSKLTASCIDLAKSDKARILGFYINHSTIEAVRLCEKWGFQKTQKIQSLYNIHQRLYRLII